VKIFWAWQSDLPGKTGRHFVRGALEEAIERIKQSGDIEEPGEQFQNGIHLDHDRKGLSGSPDLAIEILRKIDVSTVFVGDVTPVGKAAERTNDEGVTEQKLLLNPNVAIEIGYALKSISTNHIIMIMNGHYGSRADLPFDLGGKAGPIIYVLSEDADQKTIAAERKRLVSVLADALRLFIPKPVVQPFGELKPKIGRGIFFDEGEVLGTDGSHPSDRAGYTMPFRHVVWLRVIPTKALKMPLAITALGESAGSAGPFGYGSSGFGRVRQNAYGIANLSPAGNTANIDSISQFTRDGEIWGVNAEILRWDNEVKRKFVFAQPLEKLFLQTLELYMECIRRIEKVELPVEIEAGIMGIKNRIIVHSGRPTDSSLIMHNDIVTHRAKLSTFNRDERERLLFSFFEKLNNNAGISRPTESR
jgi:hypothetical protein